MAASTTDYERSLALLLPKGINGFWEDRDAVTNGLLKAIAKQLHVYTTKINTLHNEVDPLTTDELLPEWEKLYGLTATGTEAERKAALADAIIISNNRYTIEELAAVKGYNVTIQRRRHGFTRCGDLVGSEISNPAMNNAIFVNISSETARAAEVKKTLGKVKLAHNNLIFET